MSFCFRPRAMYKRTQRVDTSVGESVNRTITEYELDSRFQSFDYSTPYALLWQWGKNNFIFIMQIRPNSNKYFNTNNFNNN